MCYWVAMAPKLDIMPNPSSDYFPTSLRTSDSNLGTIGGH